MNIGVTMCSLMGVTFLFFGMLFAVLKEKGAILISGFNSLPKSERVKFNQMAMSKDMRNSLFLWSSIFGVGVILCYFISSYISIIVFTVWMILFFKEVNFDSTHAFDKYKL